MPTITPARAIERMKAAVREMPDDADLKDIYRELIPSEIDPGTLSRTELLAGITSYLDSGLTPVRAASVWRLVFVTTVRGVSYDEEKNLIRFRGRPTGGLAVAG